jgi:hypothetical protein
MSIRSLMIAGLIFSLGTAAAADDMVVAQRGNVSLTASQLKSALDREAPATRAQIIGDPKILANFEQSLVINRVVLQEALAAKWDQSSTVQNALANLRDTIVVNTYLSDAVGADPNFPNDDQIKAAYSEYQSRRYHLQQIMIAEPAAADKATDTAARRKADEAHAQATKSKANFQTLAAADSTDKDIVAAKGEMGWVPESQLLPSIKNALADMKPGAVSAPTRTDSGWHVLKLVEVQPGGKASLAQVRDQLVLALRQMHARQVAQAYIAKLVKDQPIRLNGAAIGTVVGSGS